jgi:ankyrin repeat protein
MTNKNQLNDNLIQAAQYGNLESLKYLVENGADIHAKTNYAIRFSAKNGHLEIVKYLVIDCN